MRIDKRYYSDYDWFDLEEFKCSHTGLLPDDPEIKINLGGFIEFLDHMRKHLGRPMVVNSGYRDRTHPEEAKKPVPGLHAAGLAADISATNGVDRFDIVQAAIEMADYHGPHFISIGIGKTFVHIDGGITENTPMDIYESTIAKRGSDDGYAKSVIWTYPDNR